LKTILRWRWLACAGALVLGSACAKHNERVRPDSGSPAPEDAGGVLVQLPDGVAGKACKSDRDCAPGRCARELTLAPGDEPVAAPDGYCTGACNADSQCGKDAACLTLEGDATGICLSSCLEPPPSICRKGYLCIGASKVLGQYLTGTCRPVPKTDMLGDRVAGRACADDGECEGGACESTTPLGTAYPGNYCSGRCVWDQDCGAEGACLRFAGSASAGHCYARCASEADCDREGYRCLEIGPRFLACFPAPDPLPDHRTGQPCADDADCGGAVGSCRSDLPFGSFGGFEPTPAPGGYCSQPCSRDADCGAGAQCIYRGPDGGGLCLANCGSVDDCRTGYRCEAHFRSGNPDEKVCVSPER
jgi:hypothetical protein